MSWRHSAKLLAAASMIGRPPSAAAFAFVLSSSVARRKGATLCFSTAGSIIRHIGKSEMSELLDDYELEGREGSQYCVIDVRTEDEVAYTGKLSPSVYTLPVQVIMGANAFAMDADDFEESFGFEKPSVDETLVFTCAAGVRSVYACQFAAQNGYSNLVNYVGGSNEWFSS